MLCTTSGLFRRLASRIANGHHWFAVGLLAGAFFGFLVLQSVAVWRMGARFTPNLDFRHPGFRMFIKLAIPIMLALSFVFTDQWIMRWFGSYLVPASITWLTYAKVLMQVPLAIVVHATGVASFPFLAQLYSEGKFDELNRTLNTTLKGLMLVLVPISALLAVLSRPVIYFVFSHTRLRAGDFEATAAAFVLFSLGLCFLGRTAHGLARFLRRQGYVHSCLGGDAAHFREFTRLLVLRAALALFGFGGRELLRRNVIGGDLVDLASAAHPESASGGARPVPCEDLSGFRSRSFCLFPHHRLA